VSALVFRDATYGWPRRCCPLVSQFDAFRYSRNCSVTKRFRFAIIIMHIQVLGYRDGIIIMCFINYYFAPSYGRWYKACCGLSVCSSVTFCLVAASRRWHMVSPHDVLFSICFRFVFVFPGVSAAVWARRREHLR